jgi:uncharacterized RDD family membrane protein YckC
VAAWSRERRTVILSGPSDVPMDSSFIGRAPDMPVQRPEMPDPIAQMPIAAPPPPRPMVSVSPSDAPPIQAPPPIRNDLGRGAPPVRNEDLIAQDRPRVAASTVRMSESRNEPVRLEYAGFWVRFFAYLIDAILLGIASSIISNLFLGSSLGALTQLATLGENPDTDLVLRQLGTALSGFVGATIFATVAVTILTWLYYAFLESGERQGTLGKMAMGLIVTDENSQRLSFGQASWRYFAKSLIPFGITVLTLLSLFPIVGAITTAVSSGSSDLDNSLDTFLGVFGTISAISGLGGLLLVVAYIMAAFTAKKQALHDMMAKTLVLKK